MADKQRWVRRVARRLNLALIVKSLADATVVFLVVLGVLFLAVKLVWPATWPQIAWVSLAAIPLAALVALVCQRRKFTSSQSVVVLDRRIAAGGLLMTLWDKPHAEWERRLPQLDVMWQQSLPRFRWRRIARQMALPAIFLGGVCWIPPRPVPPPEMQLGVLAQQQVQQLDEMLQRLEAEEILAPEDQDQLRDEINKLAQEVSRQPLTHESWETVETLEQQMRSALESRSLRANATASALAALQSLSETDPKLSSPRAEELIRQIEKGIEGLGSGEAAAREALQQLAGNRRPGSGAGDGQFDAQAMADALQDLADLLEQECARLGETGICKNCGKLCKPGGT